MKIICITPIKHHKGLYELMNRYCRIIYKPNINKKELSLYLKKNKNIKSIFCNPNKQNYILDKRVLLNTGVRVINTASTGLNHINLNDCKKLNIKIISLKEDLIVNPRLYNFVEDGSYFYKYKNFE